MCDFYIRIYFILFLDFLCLPFVVLLLLLFVATGVHFTFVNAIKAIYEKALSCVRMNDEFTDMFECPRGLRQGCVLSPTLFSVIVNELATEVSENGKHGVQLLPRFIELFILLFADGLALLSCSPTGLQTQLDCLQRVCLDLGLTVNTDKSKVMVLKKVGSWEEVRDDLSVVTFSR